MDRSPVSYLPAARSIDLVSNPAMLCMLKVASKQVKYGALHKGNPIYDWLGIGEFPYAPLEIACVLCSCARAQGAQEARCICSRPGSC